MIVSRGRNILKVCSKTQSLLSNTNINNYISKKWHGSYTFRTVPKFHEIKKKDLKFIEYMGGFFWWWILWHFFTEYEELIGPPTPDPDKWTDEELGIPPL